MKRTLILAAACTLFAANAMATYIVVLRNGTSYKAKSKWTVSNGKALVTLETGQTMQLDPSLIDEARSEQATARGLGDVKVLVTGAPATQTTRPQEPSLGANIQLRRDAGKAPAAAPAPSSSSTPAPAGGSGALGADLIDKFARAYENVGLYEQKLRSVDATTLRAELTADSEDKVFNAISATSFLMVRNAGVAGAQIGMVELFMQTTNGGSAGRFQMTRADAEQLDSKKISQQEYFVRKVIY